MSGYSAIAIVGSRDFPEEEMARKVIHKVLRQYPHAIVVSGGARGPDTWGEEEGRRLGGEPLMLHPDVEAHGGNFAKAALARNTEIVEASDFVLAFWDGKSRGTKDALEKTKAARKDHAIIYPDGKFIKVGYGNVYGGFSD